MYRKPKPTAPRRGWAMLWLIIWLPALLALFCAMVGIANLWLARVELENSMEAAALAAVKHWGDSNGGDTLIPRQVGVAYAAANCVRKIDVGIGTNYNPMGGPNQNATCPVGMTPPTGNLIFGAIDDSDPDNIIFNAGVMPGCLGGIVVLDVNSNGNLNDNMNEWGIAFHPTVGVDPNLRITYVTITLPLGSGALAFEPDFELSPNDPGQFAVQLGPYSQPDNLGFTDLETAVDPFVQAQHSYQLGGRRLRIDFVADPIGGDPGFQLCDRIRFGQNIDFDNQLPGNLRDGDGVGQIATPIEVGFSNGAVATGIFTNTNYRFCQATAQLSAVGCPAGADATPPGTPKRYVSLSNVDDVPCPAASGNNNDGQSLGFVGGQGNAKFGVRTQAIIPVADFGGTFLGTVPPGCVQAKATAVYDCVTRRTRLIRIDQFICPGPDEDDGAIVCDSCAPGP